MPWNADSGFHTALAAAARARCRCRPCATTRTTSRACAPCRRYVRPADRAPARGRARRLHPAARGPRRIRRHHPRPRRGRSRARACSHAPFDHFPAGDPGGRSGRACAPPAAAAVRDGAVAAYRELLDFYAKRVPPRRPRHHRRRATCPAAASTTRHLVRSFTTLDVTPEEVHRIGPSARSRGSARRWTRVMRKTGFAGDFAAFLAFLRTRPALLREDARGAADSGVLDRQAHGRQAARRCSARCPGCPYAVEPVPAHIAPKYTAGRYVEAPIDGTRAGTYWVNTHALESRPLYALRGADAARGRARPSPADRAAAGAARACRPFRTRVRASAPSSRAGALYAERLGLEAGFYADPYSDFGRLTYEMWRACRLVVDTGIHAHRLDAPAGDRLPGRRTPRSRCTR